MIKRQLLNRDEAPVPYFAILDARMRSAKAKSLYSIRQEAIATGIFYALQLFYTRATKSYLEYRQKFIALKFDHPRITDRKGLNNYEDGLTKDSRLSKVEVVKTKQGLIYRLYF